MESLVSNHNIHEALENWSWFWICLELVFFSSFVLIFTILSCSPRDALTPSVTILLCSAAALLFWRRAKHLIEPQINQILENEAARQQIKNSLEKYS